MTAVLSFGGVTSEKLVTKQKEEISHVCRNLLPHCGGSRPGGLAADGPDSQLCLIHEHHRRPGTKFRVGVRAKGALHRLARRLRWDGVQYVGSGDGHLYALDQRSGEQKWAFPQSCMPAHSAACGENGIRSSPAVDPADGSIAFGSYDGRVYKVDRTGRLLWSFATGGPIYSPASIDANGSVYVGTRHPDNLS